MPVVNEKSGIPYYYHQNEMMSVEAITNAAGVLQENMNMMPMESKQFMMAATIF